MASRSAAACTPRRQISIDSRHKRHRASITLRDGPERLQHGRPAPPRRHCQQDDLRANPALDQILSLRGQIFRRRAMAPRPQRHKPSVRGKSYASRCDAISGWTFTTPEAHLVIDQTCTSARPPGAAVAARHGRRDRVGVAAPRRPRQALSPACRAAPLTISPPEPEPLLSLRLGILVLAILVCSRSS